MKHFWQKWSVGILFSLFSCGLVVQAEPDVSRWALGNPKAPQGGTLKVSLDSDPTTLHVFNATDGYASVVNGMIYESLLERNVDSMEYMPLLAKKWEVSADKLSYTFYLDERAKFQDGQPVKAADVKFSFDAIFDPNLKGGPRLKSYYQMIDQVEVLDEHTVKIKVKFDHFRNLFVLSGYEIVPSHKFKGEDINKVMVREPMGSGPYQFSKWQKKSFIELERHPNYWGKDLPQRIGANNFARVRFNIISEEPIRLEQLKKGNLDYLPLSPKQWEKETSAPPFGTKITKLSYSNQSPQGYGYIGWRLESPLFQDKKVRQALAALVDVEDVNQKIFFGKRAQAIGPFYHKEAYISPKVKPITYDPAKAQALLKEAGWQDSNGDFILDKGEQKMAFTVLTANPESATKILPLLQDTWKKGGVEVKIQQVDFSTLLKLIDEQNFDAVMLGWSRTVDPDPTPLWHSKYAVTGGQNHVHFRNARVDEILDKAQYTIPREERIAAYQELHEIIYDEQPYLFLWENKQNFVAIYNHLGRLRDYYNYGLGTDYWWMKTN